MIQKIPKKYKDALNVEKERMKTRIQRETLKSQLNTFHKEFNKHLATFITGAFAFVAAFLWRDAINNTLNSDAVKNFILETFPFFGEYGLSYVTAFIVTIIAVVAIVIISRLLKVE